MELLPYVPFAANIAILVPVGLGTLTGLLPISAGCFPESAGWRQLTGSLWTAILACSVLGLRNPVAFSPILLLQVIYKSLWLLIYVAPRLRSPSARREVHWGMTSTFLVIVLAWPAIIPWKTLLQPSPLPPSGLKLWSCWAQQEQGQEPARDGQLQRDSGDFAAWWKTTLDPDVEEVKVIDGLAGTPLAIFTSKNCWVATVEGRKTLEINPNHQITQQLKEAVEKDAEDKSVKEMAKILYDTAVLESGIVPANAGEFSRWIYSSVQTNLDALRRPDMKEGEHPMGGSVPEEQVDEVKGIYSSATRLT